MKRVKVDFSTTVRGGLVRVNQVRATPCALVSGDPVEAFDPEEGLSFTGTVVEVDPDGQFAYLQMDWESRGAPIEIPRNTPGANFVLQFDGGGIELASTPTAQQASAGAVTITPGEERPLQYARSA